MEGGAPSMVFNFKFGFVDGKEFRSAIEYGCIGFLKNSLDGASSTICPEYITDILSA